MRTCTAIPSALAVMALTLNLVAAPRVLMVLTSADKIAVITRDHLRVPHPTGYWGETFRVPYQAFQKAGISVALASPRGACPPLDEASNDNAMKTFLADHPGIMDSVVPLRRIAHKMKKRLGNFPFDVIFLVGGHGAMVDFRDDPSLQYLLYAACHRSVYFGPTKRAVMAAVGHGAAGLLSLPPRFLAGRSA